MELKGDASQFATNRGCPIERVEVTVLVETLERVLDDRLKTQGKVSLALSGGKTPETYFNALSNASLDWGSIGIYLVDERWVSLESLDSNEHLVRRSLLVGRAREATLNGIYRAGCSINKAAYEYSREIDKLGSLDVVVLGMGSDGHIASIFPGAVGTEVGTTKSTVVVSDQERTPARISLHPRVLLNSKTVILVISGKDKESVLLEAWRLGDTHRYPVAILKALQPERLRIFSLE